MKLQLKTEKDVKFLEVKLSGTVYRFQEEDGFKGLVADVPQRLAIDLLNAKPPAKNRFHEAFREREDSFNHPLETAAQKTDNAAVGKGSDKADTTVQGSERQVDAKVSDKPQTTVQEPEKHTDGKVSDKAEPTAQKPPLPSVPMKENKPDKGEKNK